jgi:hypothetical protein
MKPLVAVAIVCAIACADCGGEAFVYDPPVGLEARPEAGLEAAAQPEAGFEAGPEAGSAIDGNVEASPSVDAEADAPPAEDAGCTLAPTAIGDCDGTNFQAPQRYCASVYDQTDPSGNPIGTPRGVVVKTPTQCQCAGAYTCGCLFGVGNWCPTGSYYGVASCGVSAGALRLVCEGGDAG